MAKCRDCGKPNAMYMHDDGSRVCENCLGQYFTCPRCGNLYDQEDRENGDSGDGFCVACSMKDE